MHEMKRQCLDAADNTRLLQAVRNDLLMSWLPYYELSSLAPLNMEIKSVSWRFSFRASSDPIRGRGKLQNQRLVVREDVLKPIK
jgi:hypothetical protein